MQDKANTILIKLLQLGIFLFLIAIIPSAEAAEASFKMTSLKKGDCSIQQIIDFNRKNFLERKRNSFKVILVEKNPEPYLEKPVYREYTVYREVFFRRNIEILLKIGSFSTTFYGYVGNGIYKIIKIDEPIGSLYGNLSADNAALNDFKDMFEEDINNNLVYFNSQI